jgi:hypothetical protein
MKARFQLKVGTGGSKGQKAALTCSLESKFLTALLSYILVFFSCCSHFLHAPLRERFSNVILSIYKAVLFQMDCCYVGSLNRICKGTLRTAAESAVSGCELSACLRLCNFQKAQHLLRWILLQKKENEFVVKELRSDCIM